MLLNPKLNDLVISNSSSTAIGKIIKINTYWGWFMVKFPDHTKEYRLVKDGNLRLRRLTEEERADYYLNQEKLGITDSWRE